MFKWSRTSDGALAGISGCRGTDSIRRGRDVITTVLYDNGVPARTVRDIRHSVCTVTVVMDTGLLRFTILVLKWKGKTMRGQCKCRLSFVCKIMSVCVCVLLTVMSTLSWPWPASLASMLNSTGKLAGTPLVSPGPLARTLLAS